MKILKKLLYFFSGLFTGNFIVCTILILLKDRDYMRFWSYAGYIYFPFYDFILFLLPLVTYPLVFKVVKKPLLEKFDFFIIGLLIPLVDQITDVLKIADKMPWYFYIPISFWFIVLSYSLFKKIANKRDANK